MKPAETSLEPSIDPEREGRPAGEMRWESPADRTARLERERKAAEAKKAEAAKGK